MLAGLGAAALMPACRRSWLPPEADPTARSQVKPYVPGAEAYATFEERWIPSSCAQCPAACGIRVRVVEGRAVHIEGNPDNPINRGGIGVRGLSGLQTLYDPDRITQPLRRIGDRLVPITWDAALAQLADALAKLRARAPERLLVMSGRERGFVHELFARFARVFGTPQFVAGGHGATLARAMEQSLGVHEVPAYAWAGAGAILSLEASLFEDACRTIYVAQARRDRARRIQLVHAGPVFDLAAYNADRWLRIRPGTAGALALGFCHVLLRDNTYAHDLVDRARGFAELRALAADYPPERVAAITGCDGGRVGELAHELWERWPVVVVIDERSLAFTNGVDTGNVAIALSALLGSIENPHGGLRIAPAAPTRAWAEPTLDARAERGLAAAAGDAEIALLYYANPVYSRPHASALAKIPLVVSFSPFLDDTVADVADLVLPDHTYLERLEDATPLPGAPRAVAGVCRPAVTPLHATRGTGDVIIDLAQRLGLAAFPWRTARDAFEERWLGLHDAARGTIVEPNPHTFLDRFYAAGFWAEHDDAAPRAVELALPAHWSEPRWDGDAAKFPLTLVAYHPLGHADGSGANQPWLRNLTGRPGLGAWTFAASLSPADAPRGVNEGDRVRVVSPHGSLVMKVHLDDRIAAGSIAIPTGGGHRAYGRWARGFGVNVMELVGSGPLCSTRVYVEAA